MPRLNGIVSAVYIEAAPGQRAVIVHSLASIAGTTRFSGPGT